MFDYKEFLNPGFWFSASAPLVSASIRLLWGVFGLFIILAIVTKLVLHMRKGKLAPWLSRALHKLYKMFWAMGVIGLALLFFGYEGIPYLSSRIVYPLWLLVVLAWLIYIVVHVWKRLAQDRLAWQQQKQVKEYLPGK